MTRPHSGTTTIAHVLAGATVLLVIASIPLSLLDHQTVGVIAGFGGVLTLSFVAVGVIVARREPCNAIGWILLAVGLLLVLCTLGDAALYLRLDYGLHHGDLPLGSVAVVLGQAWPASLLLGPVAILLFPDGRLPSARWRPVLRTYVAASAALLVALLLTGVNALVQDRVRVDSGGLLASPAPSFLSGPVLSAAGAVLAVVIVASWIAFLSRQALSYHRSTGERRQQLKWAMSGAAITALAIPLFSTLGQSDSTIVRAGSLLAGLGLAALPLGIGVAILRYRLYDIDRLISRTLSYAILSGLLVALYLGIVTLTTRALPLSSPVGVASSTLAAAALFNPLRRRIQHLVDRRFNRARYDAEATVAAFASQLRDAVDLDTVRQGLLDAVGGAVEPTVVSLWIRPLAVDAPNRT